MNGIKVAIKESRALNASGDEKAAVSKLKTILRLRISPQIKMQAATILLRTGKVRGNMIEKVADVFYAGGDFVTSANLYKEASAAISKIPATRKHRSKILFQIGRSYERSDKFRAAIKIYKDLLAKFPQYGDKTEVRYHIGLCYQRIGKDTIGEQHFSKILKNEPNSEYIDNILYRMATRRDKKDKRTEALELYKELLARFPRSHWADKCWHGKLDLHYLKMAI